MVEYSYLVGLWKTVKANLIIWGPALLAFLAAVPLEYTWIASIIIYWLKNLLEIKYDYKV